jgi:diacylglycerol O-acyltransferase / wax synthase
MVTRMAARQVAVNTLGLEGERMSKVDTAWLRMDTSGNLMEIIGVWTLKPAVGYDALCKRIEERLLKYNRFRQKVVEDVAGASWVEDDRFDIHRHVVREKLAKYRKGQHQQALQQRIGELAMEPLDRAHPLWRMHLVEDYDGGSAMIVRIHHCIADGIALISVTMSLVDGGEPPPVSRRKQAAASPQDWFADLLVKPFTDVAVKTLGMAGDGTAKWLELLHDPHKGVAGSADLAKLAMRVVNDAAALLLMPDDSKTRLKGLPVGEKRVAWCPPVPLDEVKAIGRALNCSINDVLLSCVAGAIGQYLRDVGDETDAREIRAMVPVNLRPLDQAHKLGNRFGLAPLVLPIGMQNPIERVYEVRRRMNQLKDSTQPVLAFLVLAISGLLIKPAQDAITGMFQRKTTAVMTNVPGPREKLKFLGSTLEQSMFWVPQSGNVGVGVSILSYGGGVQFGLITDIALCPDPQKIIDEFEPEFAKLSLVTLMLPWDQA